MSCFLAIDTAHNACNVGLCTPEGRMIMRHKDMKRGQSEALMPLVADVFKEAGVAASDLDAIFVNNGPGRFTGIRLGLSAAKGLALPFDTMVVGLTSCELFAAEVFAQETIPDDTGVAVVVNSGRGNVFFQLWGQAAMPEAEIVDFSPEDAVHRMADHDGWLMLVGDAVHLVKPFLPHEKLFACHEKSGADAATMLTLGQEKIAKGQYNPVARPFYGRAPDVTIAKDA